MAAKFHGTFLEIDGTINSLGTEMVLATDQTSGVQSRSMTFRNDTAQTWPIVGKLSISGNFTEHNGPTFASSLTYSLKGSDGSDIELSPVSETDFTGQINPFITYTLKITGFESLTDPILGSGVRLPTDDFSVQIGTDVPEPPAVALALAGVLVAMALAARSVRCSPPIGYNVCHAISILTGDAAGLRDTAMRECCAGRFHVPQSVRVGYGKLLLSVRNATDRKCELDGTDRVCGLQRAAANFCWVRE